MSICRSRPSQTSILRSHVRTQHRKHQRKICVRTEANQNRRAVLLSIGLLSCELRLVARAEENGKATTTTAEIADRPRVLKSAAGFEFVYPSSWLVAFERGESMKEGTIALVGNFLSIDTFSVEKIKMDDITASNLKTAAEDMIQPIQQSPSSISFELLDGAYRDTLQGRGSVYVLEYNVETCKGLVTEGLGGKKLCKDAKDNELITVSRHHLLGVTMAANTVYILKASCPSARWETVKKDLWMTMSSFVVQKNSAERSV